MILAISTCKGSDDAFEDARLINAVNQGGLWCPSQESMKIFKIVELKFRHLVRVHQTTIDVDMFVLNALKDMDIWNILRGILQACDTKISKAYKKTSLRMILVLFVKVRIHSFTRQKNRMSRRKN